ncbi:MAG: alpha/beta hydrolase [Planctomycetaceae bacterium]|nr:alpha/beta hydrolase [Planctomycetaceae bacterium]
MSLLALSLIVALQRRLIYQPWREPVLHSMAGASAERLKDVEIVTADGLRLKGWHVAAGPVINGPDAARRLVIYFQGNAAHRGRRSPQFTMFSDLGCEVLIVDYRGYGENPGRPDEQGLYNDARAIWRYAIETLKFDPGQIVLFGESLGGGVAVALGEELCRSGVVPGGIVLRATFSSLVDAARFHYPYLPVSWALVDRYPSIDRIREITCPLLVMHGDQDRIVPFEQAEQLFAAAAEESANGAGKKFVRLAGAGHNDILYVAAEQVEDALREFLHALR